MRRPSTAPQARRAGFLNVPGADVKDTVAAETRAALMWYGPETIFDHVMQKTSYSVQNEVDMLTTLLDKTDRSTRMNVYEAAVLDSVRKLIARGQT